MKKKLLILFSVCTLFLLCFAGFLCSGQLKIDHKQLTSDFIKAELVYEKDAEIYPRVYEVKYLFTDEEAEQLLIDLGQMKFEEMFRVPSRPRNERYSIKLSYTNRIMFFDQYSITYYDKDGIHLLENYKEYSKYPSYMILSNDDFMEILEYYISKIS